MPKSNNTIARESFPARRHRARSDGDVVQFGIQPGTLRQLYFDRVVPVDRTVPVTFALGAQPPREFRSELEGVDRYADDDVIVLQVRPAEELRP